ncbi:ABC transporter permease [Mobiluncus mulieris]|uniref:ABC transporter permease n=1 Tax=Mobiluncus mulieris TaxID=2052 RepID=UPI00146FEC1E|nr:iron ABC transporter permease [Mobiluncus mulieris]NMX10970.1 iron ABC transporter permease [Mobiluncus mulieris]
MTATLPAPSAAIRGTRKRERTKVKSDPVTLILVAVVSVGLFFLVGLPLFKVLSTALSGDGAVTLGKMFTSKTNRDVITNTIILGVMVASVGTVIGFLMAFVQVKVRCRGKRILHLLSLLPIVSPPFAVATASITLFGKRGIISHQLLGLDWHIYGLPGLTLVLSLSFFPVAYQNLAGMLKALDPATEEASASLGGNAWTVFRTVTFPMLIPGFAASFLLLFVEGIADLANPLVIGGDFTVLAARAYIAINGEYNTAAGAAYSLLLLVPALLVFVVQRYWTNRTSTVTVTGKPAGKPKQLENRVASVILATLAWLVAAFIITIYTAVFVGAFVNILGVDNTFTLDNFAYILSGIGNKSMVDTTILALIATPIAGILGMLLAWLVAVKLRRGAAIMDFVGMLGMAVPGTVIGIGYLVTYNHPVQFMGWEFLPALAGGGSIFGGAMAIVLVYISRSTPAGQRSGIAALQQVDKAIDEASTSLGASGLQTFIHTTLPIIRPAYLTGLTYAFARSMTTLSPIIFITTPSTKIMTSQILSEVDAGRFGNAFAFCTILIVIVMTVIGGINLILHDKAPGGAQIGSGL